MSKRFPLHPSRPERICWGCDRYCAAEDMACSNERAPHPVELFGEDWMTWTHPSGTEVEAAPAIPIKQP